MTPQEADILRFLERRGGIVTDTQMQGQFSMAPGALGIVLDSLKRHQCVEQDRRHLRITTVGEDELGKFERQSHYVPFEGRPRW